MYNMYVRPLSVPRQVFHGRKMTPLCHGHGNSHGHRHCCVRSICLVLTRVFTLVTTLNLISNTLIITIVVIVIVGIISVSVLSGGDAGASGRDCFLTHPSMPCAIIAVRQDALSAWAKQAAKQA